MREWHEHECCAERDCILPQFSSCSFFCVRCSLTSLYCWLDHEFVNSKFQWSLFYSALLGPARGISPWVTCYSERGTSIWLCPCWQSKPFVVATRSITFVPERLLDCCTLYRPLVHPNGCICCADKDCPWHLLPSCHQDLPLVPLRTLLLRSTCCWESRLRTVSSQHFTIYHFHHARLLSRHGLTALHLLVFFATTLHSCSNVHH